MSVINTNYLALVSQNNLTKSQNALGTAIERLSSGMRINSAKDDAAGQAIANRFTANIKGLTQAARNANDGISIAQTTEGSLNEINNNLQRIRELTVQAANGSNSDSDRQSIQNEIDERLAEIDRVSRETQFNGKYVLGEHGNSLAIQVGAQDNQTITIELQRIDSTELNLSTFTVAGDRPVTQAQMESEFGATVTGSEYDVGGTAYTVATNGDVTNAAGSAIYVDAAGGLTTASTIATTLTLDESSITSDWTADPGNPAAGTTGNYTYTLEVDGETYEAIIAESTGGTRSLTSVQDGNGDDATGATIYEDAAGNYTLNGSLEAATEDDVAAATGSTLVGRTLNIATGDQAGNYTVDGEGVVTNATGDELYLSKNDDGESILVVEADAQQATENPLAALDAALQKVDDLRSHLGAIQNRFESTIANLNNTVNNLSAARSRIEDADYAVEVSNMTRAQILQQAGTSVLAQANQVPQTVLSLLR